MQIYAERGPLGLSCEVIDCSQNELSVTKPLSGQFGCCWGSEGTRAETSIFQIREALSVTLNNSELLIIPLSLLWTELLEGCEVKFCPVSLWINKALEIKRKEIS